MIINEIIYDIEKNLKDVLNKKETSEVNYEVSFYRTVSLKDGQIIFSDGYESLDIYYITDYLRMKILTEQNIELKFELKIYDASESMDYDIIYNRLKKEKNLRIKYKYGKIIKIIF